MADIIFPGEAPDATLGSTRLPDNLDLEIWQGDAQNFIIQMTTQDGEPLDLTGYTPEAVIRQSFSSPTVYAFICTKQNGNEVRVYMPSSVVNDIPAGDALWNFQLVDINGDARTYLAGDVKVHPQVD